MPLFEYRCGKCNHLFEELITGDRDQKVACPSCGSEETQKRMSAIGGIAMGRSSSSPSCGIGGGCSSAGSCSSGMCPHAM